MVLKPILAKISVLKHLDHVPGEGLGGRRRRPKLDKSGQKLKELKVFLCPETRKTSSFCAPHGATICPPDSVLFPPKVHNDLRYSSASQYGAFFQFDTIVLSLFVFTQARSIKSIAEHNVLCRGSDWSKEGCFRGLLLYDPFVILFTREFSEWMCRIC